MVHHAKTFEGPTPIACCESLASITDASPLSAYAAKHRLRTRNLHDGGSVPPGICKSSRDRETERLGYIGRLDRCDSIVGFRGYIVGEGQVGRLGIYVFYKSALGASRVHAAIEAMGGVVRQVGDTEISGTVPGDRIEEALRLIKVSKLRPGNARNFDRGSVQETHTG